MAGKDIICIEVSDETLREVAYGGRSLEKEVEEVLSPALEGSEGVLWGDGADGRLSSRLTVPV